MEYHLDGQLTPLKELFNGTKPIFRKHTTSQVELYIAKEIARAQRHGCCTPHIVNIYKVGAAYIDMEYLQPNKDNAKFDVSAMAEAKRWLQSKNIVYLDWRVSNTGVSPSGTTKLFDFDGCGVVLDGVEGKWLYSPNEEFSVVRMFGYKYKNPLNFDDYVYARNVLKLKEPCTTKEPCSYWTFITAASLVGVCIGYKLAK